jgi:hypothetical protein
MSEALLDDSSAYSFLKWTLVVRESSLLADGLDINEIREFYHQ